MGRKLRENAHLSAEGWSDWVRAIVPAENQHDEHSYEDRSADQTGVMCTNIREVLEHEMSKCGIYEWQARQPGGRNVVYVGSTCTAKRGSLRTRVLQYCTHGSHKSELINDALERGYELFVRVKTSGRNNMNNKLRAEEMENGLLEQYDYAWNIRGNDADRDIL